MHNLNSYPIDSLFENLCACEENNITEKILPKVKDKRKNMVLKIISIDKDENDYELTK